MDARDRGIAEDSIRRDRVPPGVRPTQEQLPAPLTPEEEEDVQYLVNKSSGLPPDKHAALVARLIRCCEDQLREELEREQRDKTADAATPPEER